MENYAAMKNVMAGKSFEGHGKIRIIDITLSIANTIYIHIYIFIQKNGVQNFVSDTLITLVILKMMKAQDIEREISKEIALDSQILSPISCLFFFPPFCPGSRQMHLSSSESGIFCLCCQHLTPGSSSALPPHPHPNFLPVSH